MTMVILAVHFSGCDFDNIGNAGLRDYMRESIFPYQVSVVVCVWTVYSSVQNFIH
jgi:hypothetical protein